MPALDFEVLFLKLIEKVSNGCVVEINYSGTSVTFRPGLITGGKVHFDCGVARGIGYYLEPLILLAPFAKKALNVTLAGITNSEIDLSVDIVRTVILPLLKRFGIEDGAEFKVRKLPSRRVRL